MADRNGTERVFPLQLFDRFSTGGIVFGTDFELHHCFTHGVYLCNIGEKYFIKAMDYAVSPKFGIQTRWSGTVPPSFPTKLGSCSYSKKWNEVNVQLSLDITITLELDEELFRQKSVYWFTQAVEKGAAYIERRNLPFDAEDLRRRWALVAEEYLSLPLPLPKKMPIYPDSPLPGVEYFFVFSSSRARAKFLKAIETKGLKVDINREGSEYWCTLSDETSMDVDSELLSNLTEIAKNYGGECDGWAAPKLP